MRLEFRKFDFQVTKKNDSLQEISRYGLFLSQELRKRFLDGKKAEIGKHLCQGLTILGQPVFFDDEMTTTPVYFRRKPTLVDSRGFEPTEMGFILRPKRASRSSSQGRLGPGIVALHKADPRPDGPTAPVIVKGL